LFLNEKIKITVLDARNLCRSILAVILAWGGLVLLSEQAGGTTISAFMTFL
jgi:hypothetical protein